MYSKIVNYEITLPLLYTFFPDHYTKYTKLFVYKLCSSTTLNYRELSIEMIRLLRDYTLLSTYNKELCRIRPLFGMTWCCRAPRLNFCQHILRPSGYLQAKIQPRLSTTSCLVLSLKVYYRLKSCFFVV
jgi:hypothetical protein